MIEEVRGNLVEQTADLLCHQANFFGVMGGGVALAIRNRLLDAAAMEAYRDLCAQRGRELLGTIQLLPFVRPKDGHAGTVVNLFSQDDQTQPDGGITRYDHMRTCLLEVERIARENGYTVALPGGMGCGIAGGKWSTVQGVIREVFEASPVKLTIVYFK